MHSRNSSETGRQAETSRRQTDAGLFLLIPTHLRARFPQQTQAGPSDLFTGPLVLEQSLHRVRIAPRQLELRFLNHLPPQGIWIRIENRSGIPLKNEPRAQFHFPP